MSEEKNDITDQIDEEREQAPDSDDALRQTDGLRGSGAPASDTEGDSQGD